MKKLKVIDLMLIEATQMLIEASKLLEESYSLETKKNLFDVGSAIHSVWEIRNRIYELEPSLTSNVVSDFKNDELKFNQLEELEITAEKFEQNGQTDEARNIYQKLLEESSLSHFTLLAEAGLYRNSSIRD